MNGTSGQNIRFVVRNGLLAYHNRKLSKRDWQKNLMMARQNAKLRVAREKDGGLERSHALTDINRKIIKKKMMTVGEAYERNRMTKPFGMFWVLCG
jgi:hypothetical protein